MCPYEGVRSPFGQARYWRRSRTDEETWKEIRRLEESGASFLAHCIESVGPQEGKQVTNALPGYSWHQWGEALDCFWWVNNEMVWDTELLVDGLNGYAVYGEEAKKLGLDCGLYWSSFVDAPHVQLRSTAGPHHLYSLQEINDEMERLFKEEIG